MKTLKMNEKAFSSKEVILHTDCLNGCLCIAIVGDNFNFLEHTSSLNLNKLSEEWNNIIDNNLIKSIHLYASLSENEFSSEEAEFLKSKLSEQVHLIYYLTQKNSLPSDNFVQINNNSILTGLHLL